MTLGHGRPRPEGAMGLVLVLVLVSIILIYTPNLLAGEREDSRLQCAEVVLAEAAAGKRPQVYTRENIRYGVGRAHPKDLFRVLALQSGGVMGLGALERVPLGIDDPRLGHPEAQRIQLLAPNGDEVTLVFTPELGREKAFLITPALVVKGRRVIEDQVYVVHTDVGRPSGTEVCGPVPLVLGLRPESNYRQVVNWADLDEATRERLGREMGRRTTAVDQGGGTAYRTAVTPPVVEVVPLRVRMPTGSMFTQVDDPHFRELGMSYRDDTTGLIWSQAFKDGMDWDAAKKACEKIGGRLPTGEEFARWSSNLGFRENLLQNLFPESRQRWFWSSSDITIDGVRRVQGFDSHLGLVKAFDDRGWRLSRSVRCVR